MTFINVCQNQHCQNTCDFTERFLYFFISICISMCIPLWLCVRVWFQVFYTELKNGRPLGAASLMEVPLGLDSLTTVSTLTFNCAVVYVTLTLVANLLRETFQLWQCGKSQPRKYLHCCFISAQKTPNNHSLNTVRNVLYSISYFTNAWKMHEELHCCL